MMKQNKDIKVLVLGARGMVGRAVYAFLKIYASYLVYGTVVNRSELNPDLFLLRAKHAVKDFSIIKNKVKKINYIINCIGAKDEDKILDLIFVNSYFPHVLSRIAKKFDIKLIHISTDAVFNPVSGKVNEKDIPTPLGVYGASKLLGEPHNKNAITIRTSIIGFNSPKKDTLLERALRSKNGINEGYINQKWSGCTTLQFAMLLKNIITKNNFNELKNNSCLFHFSPLGPITKHKLLSEFLKITSSSFHIQKSKGERRNRILTSIYFDIMEMNNYTNDVKKALIDLYQFEKKVVRHEKKI